MAKKRDPLLDEIMQGLDVVKNRIMEPGSEVEVKEILAYTGQLATLRAQNHKISPDEEISGLDKLRRKLTDGDTQSGRDTRSTKAPKTEEGEDSATS